jgi:N4-gp56 family major capsid protein
MPAVPVGTTTQNPGLLHQASAIYFVKKGLDRLMPELYFWQLGYQVTLPKNVGRTIQMFRFNLPGQNTIPAAEGVNPNPVPQSSYPITSIVEQYSDYMDSSTLYDETDINSIGAAAQMVEDLSFRAALSTDSITRAELDSNTAYTVPTIGANLTVADFKANRSLMQGSNVRPYGSGDWMAVIHPYVEYDIMSDNTAGGFIDALKYTQGTRVLNGEIGKVAGTRIMSSTNVNITGTAPNQLYSAYMFGYQAFAVIPLAGSGPSKVTDPKNQRFKVSVVKPGIGPANPTGEIGTIASYRFVMATKITDPQRMRIILCNASLV